MSVNVSPLTPRNARARVGETLAGPRLHRPRRGGRRDRRALRRRGRPRRALPHRGLRGATRAAGCSACWFQRELGGEGARAGRRRRRLRHPRPRLRLERDDLRHASGQARLPRAPRPRRRLAARFPARGRRAPMAARLLDHRGRQRRRHPLERGAGALLRRPRLTRARRLRHLLWREADALVTTARRSDSAANSDQVLVVFRQERLHARADRSPGTRSACAAPAASASSFAPRATPIRCWPSPTSASTARPWCPTRICSGARPGAASPPARSRALAPSCARRRARPAARMPPAAAQLTRARLSLETLRGAVQAGLARLRAQRRRTRRPRDDARPNSR